MTKDAPRLALKNISHTYRNGIRRVPALEQINLQVQPGEFVTLIGPSGSGKSTLFNIITGLLKPESGSIEMNGHPMKHCPGKSAYMPQRDALLPWRTILDNVVIGPEVRGQNRRQARHRAMELMPLFGLEGFEHSFPSQLSGGMRQRAALLRTFLAGQDLLLLDEPFVALDALTRRDLQSWLLDVWQHFKYTILFITHDVEEAVFLSDRVIVLSKRPGRVVMEAELSLERPRREHYRPFDHELIKQQLILFEALKESV